MLTRLAILRCTACLGIGALACTKEAGGVQGVDRTAIAARVAEEATSELALSIGSQVVEPQGVRFENGVDVGRALTTYRVWIPRDHWHAYQVAVSGDRIITLGGFQHQDLVSAGVALAPSAVDATSLRETAEKLARLADNSGAVQYSFPGRADASGVGAGWKRIAPESWPRDTVVELRGGKWRVTLTLLSQETRSFTLHWVPTAYAFTFDSSGLLHAWARRPGEPVAEQDLTRGTSDPIGPTKKP